MVARLLNLGKSRPFKHGVVLVALLWFVALVWLGANSDLESLGGYRFTGPQTDYYNLLVDGFLKGSVALDRPVHPDLLSSDPKVRLAAPYLLDATLYKGRYFLYYGPAPAVLVLLPYTAITGHHLSLNVACLLFLGCGLIFSASFLCDFARRYAPQARFRSGMAAAVLLFVAPGTALLARRSSFYDLPVASAYAFTALLITALFRATGSPNRGRWFALASAAFGLAVASRANLILLGPALAIFFLADRESRTRVSRWVAFLFPAAAIGGLLALYNFARFENPFDTGFAYGLNSFFTSGHPLFSWRFVGFNFASYFLKLPTFAPWFPFVFPVRGDSPELYSNPEDLSGFLPSTLIFLWIAYLVWRYRTRRDGQRLALYVFLGLAALSQLAFLLPMGIRAYRYTTDFFTPLSFAAASGLVLVAASFQANRISKYVTAILCAGLSLHALLSAVQLFDAFQNQRPQSFAFLDRIFTPEFGTLRKLGAPRPAPLSVEVAFKQPPEPTLVSLIGTGLPHQHDLLRGLLHPSGLLELAIFHSGFGGPQSQLIPIEWGRTYKLRLTMGSLYPKAGDGYFDRFSPERGAQLKAMGVVEMEGRIVVQRRMKFYESAPWTRDPAAVLGAKALSAQQYLEKLQVTREPLSMLDELIGSGEVSCAISVDLHVLAPESITRLPILQSGESGTGTLVLIEAASGGKYHLAADVWGGDFSVGPEFEADVQHVHHLQIFAGPALSRDKLAQRILTKDQRERLSRRLFFWLDGQLIGRFELPALTPKSDELVLGANEAGFSSAAPAFVGDFRAVKMTPAAQETLIRAAAAEAAR